MEDPGRPWASLGPPWGPLGEPWGVPGGPWGSPGGPKATPGRSKVVLGMVFGPLGPSEDVAAVEKSKQNSQMLIRVLVHKPKAECSFSLAIF